MHAYGGRTVALPEDKEARRGMGWDGMGWDGMGWDGMEGAPSPCRRTKM